MVVFEVKTSLGSELVSCDTLKSSRDTLKSSGDTPKSSRDTLKSSRSRKWTNDHNSCYLLGRKIKPLIDFLKTILDLNNINYLCLVPDSSKYYHHNNMYYLKLLKIRQTYFIPGQ
jgi:hypothetical protein